MKKVLLIMTDMECGGVQISLLNFINALMKENVDITLLLDDASGEWIDRIPSNIKIRTVNMSVKVIINYYDLIGR